MSCREFFTLLQHTLCYDVISNKVNQFFANTVLGYKKGSINSHCYSKYSSDQNNYIRTFALSSVCVETDQSDYILIANISIQILNG